MARYGRWRAAKLIPRKDDNNLTTVNQYDPGTGLLTGISTGVGLSGSAIQYLTYQYDTLGNLKQRVDGNQANRTENFGYDNLNRMTSANIAGVVNKTVSYDSLGNITTKSDVGTYSYDLLHVHAVKTARAGSYTYNDRSGDNRRNSICCWGREVREWGEDGGVC